MKKVITLLLSMIFISCVTTPKFPPSYVKDKGLTVVMFGADWCYGCVDMKEKLNKLQQKHGFTLLYINSDDETSALTMEHDGLSRSGYIPVVSVYRDGKLVHLSAMPWTSTEMFEDAVLGYRGGN